MQKPCTDNILKETSAAPVPSPASNLNQDLSLVEEDENTEYDALFITDLLEHMSLNKIPAS